MTTILLIVWVALKAERCNQRQSYDYSYTPSYPVYDPYRNTGRAELDTALERTERALDELATRDASWGIAVGETDPLAIAANPKNPQCQALDGVVEDTPSWAVGLSDTLLAGDAETTDVKAPFPMFIAREDDGLPRLSPEGMARWSASMDQIVDGTYTSVPRLTMRDLVVEVGLMPKPEKGVKRPKGAPVPGKPIARGWIYDHATKRVVCAGFVPLPNPAKGEAATQLTDAQIAKLVDIMPSALKATPLPVVEAP